MKIILYALLGTTAGLHSACWGAFKDSLFEKFSLRKFFRSIVIGSILGAILGIFLERTQMRENAGVIFLVIVACERFTTEVWKAFLRQENQAKYDIPSTLHFFGKTIESTFLRIFVGFVFVFCAFFFVFVIPSLVSIDTSFPLIDALLWGGIAGLVGSAFGGAFKDAPIEGFEYLKFWRSPLVAAMWAVLLSFLTNNISFLILASIGGERMTVELYKSFITGRKPGKFAATKPTYPSWKEKRKKIIYPYAATWAIFCILSHL